MKPICIPCQRFYKPKKTGFYFLEGYPSGNGKAPPGTAEPQAWRPYKLWAGDIYECNGCGGRIIVGAGLKPLAEHYQDGFDEMVERYGAKFQVNDC
jgi:hypothetical protein